MSVDRSSPHPYPRPRIEVEGTPAPRLEAESLVPVAEVARDAGTIPGGRRSVRSDRWTGGAADGQFRRRAIRPVRCPGRSDAGGGGDWLRISRRGHLAGVAGAVQPADGRSPSGGPVWFGSLARTPRAAALAVAIAGGSGGHGRARDARRSGRGVGAAARRTGRDFAGAVGCAGPPGGGADLRRGRRRSVARVRWPVDGLARVAIWYARWPRCMGCARV